MNYRAKNIGIAVALAALAAILTSVYVVNYKRHVQHGEGKVTVLVAARDIPAGTSGADVVDQHMLTSETVPRKAVVAGAISSPDQLSQYISTADVYKGEQVTTRRFSPPQEQGIRAQIKGTQRAYQLEGSQHQLLAGTLKAGDHVDMIGTWQVNDGGTNNGPIVSRDVVQNLLVLTPPAAPASGGGAALAATQNSAYVQLRATDLQTTQILWLQKNSIDQGNGWHLALRPPNGSLDSPPLVNDARTLLLPGPGRRPH
jgi:pilus assembly protein CpaB